MRRRRAQTANTFLNNDLKKQVNKLMDNRRRILAPFPIAAEEIYRAGWSPEEMRAIEILKPRGDMLREGRTMHVSELPLGDGVAQVTIKLREDVPMPGYTMRLKFGELPSPLQHTIATWAPKWYDLKQEQNRLLLKVEQVAKVCKTYGQLYRLWPDILSLFDDTGRQKVNEMRAQSRLPDEVYEWSLDEGTRIRARSSQIKEMFRPEAFAPFTSMIAECLMLPTDETEEVAYIS